MCMYVCVCVCACVCVRDIKQTHTRTKLHRQWSVACTDVIICVNTKTASYLVCSSSCVVLTRKHQRVITLPTDVLSLSTHKHVTLITGLIILLTSETNLPRKPAQSPSYPYKARTKA